MTSFRPTRRYPNIPAITDDLRSHTLALRALAESVNIYTRATQDIRSSFVRVGELVDLGLITLDGNSNGVLTTVDLSEIAGLGDLSGATEGDFLRYRSGEWANDGLDTADITSGMVTQHEGALTIDWSQLSSVPSTFTPAAHVHDAADITTGSFDHGALTGLADDDHTQYLRADGTRDLTGSQSTQALLPTTDDTYALGSSSDRYSTAFLAGVESVKGDGATVTRAAGSTIIAHVSKAAGATAVLTASPSSGAAVLIGGVNAASTSTATLRSTGLASLVVGQANSSGSSPATVEATSSGAMAVGFAVNANSVIQATSAGSFAAGVANIGGIIRATTSFGTFAHGYAATAGVIEATGNGAFASGYALGATIQATGSGAFAGGYAFSQAITASGNGAFVWGYTEFGLADIVATATNAVQFGPGTNAVADSLRVGTAGLHFKGTTGAFGTQLNGQLWMGSTSNAYVMVRSNGADVRLGPVQTWTTGAHSTRRDFTGTSTAAHALELLETLVEDLRASNII